jgi:3D (Asp-Asp-Asp) domain-containing protein
MKLKETIQIVFTILVLVAWCIFIPEPKKEVTEISEPETIIEEVPDSTPVVSKKSKRVGYLTVRTTYYNPVEAQCDSDPLVTADGSNIDLRKLRKGNLKWLAISQDLLPEYPLGTKVKITSKKYPEISGVYVIHDVMNPRFRYSIDVLSHIDHGHIFGTHLTKMEKV